MLASLCLNLILMKFSVLQFSAIPYNRLVKPNQEATLAYSFFISDAYSTRPYGLTVNLLYKDQVCECLAPLMVSFICIVFQDGNRFMNAVFNQTVNIVEIDEGLDGETFFLYVFLAAIVAGLLFVAHHYLLSMNVSITFSSIFHVLSSFFSEEAICCKG